MIEKKKVYKRPVSKVAQIKTQIIATSSKDYSQPVYLTLDDDEEEYGNGD